MQILTHPLQRGKTSTNFLNRPSHFTPPSEKSAKTCVNRGQVTSLDAVPTQLQQNVLHRCMLKHCSWRTWISCSFGVCLMCYPTIPHFIHLHKRYLRFFLLLYSTPNSITLLRHTHDQLNGTDLGTFAVQILHNLLP